MKNIRKILFPFLGIVAIGILFTCDLLGKGRDKDATLSDVTGMAPPIAFMATLPAATKATAAPFSTLGWSPISDYIVHSIDVQEDGKGLIGGISPHTPAQHGIVSRGPNLN
jgi:hypothetical protein